MRSLIVFVAALSVIAGNKIPLKFQYGGSAKPGLRSVTQCPGHEDDALVVLEGNSPDNICMPGEMSMDVNTLIREDLPNDLIIELKLQKLEPFPMTVPCLNGIGSCPYDLCPMIVDMADVLCPSFPESQPCGCPLLAGEMNLPGLVVPVPDMGPILGAVMEGSYEATASFYGASNPDKSLGCIILAFSLENC